MSISFSRYVNITSGLQGVAQVGSRNLNGLIVTSNPLVPTGTVLNFASATAVGAYFGTTSEEYYRAVFYFSFISKNTQQPQQLSFWFWNNDVATGSLIYGVQGTYAVSTFSGITTGDFTLTLGGFTDHLTGISFSGDSTLAQVAATIQTAIRAYSSGGIAWTGATVTYNATTNQFNLVSGTTGADTISVTAGTTTDVSALLGWGTGAIFSNGTAAQLLPANLALLASISNNFGSFCLTNTLSIQANIISCAAWNYSLSPNIQYLYCWAAPTSTVLTIQSALAGTGGHAGTLSPLTAQYPEMLPMAVLGATNYAARNSVQNYEFQQANLTASVTTDALANTYDAALINYYGQTQINGSTLAFYQRGIMSGGQAVDPKTINVWVNELWLKSAISGAIINLLLAQAQVSANNQGLSQLTAIVQSVISQAVLNGTISVGNPLSTTQITAITNTTGNPLAWQQVQTVGYWLNVTFQQVTINNLLQWEAVYTLIYAKDNVISTIIGTDILI